MQFIIVYAYQGEYSTKEKSTFGIFYMFYLNV